MTDPNSVDYNELIRDCMREDITRILPLQAVPGVKRYAVIIAPLAIARLVRDHLLQEGSEITVRKNENLPLRGRN